MKEGEKITIGNKIWQIMVHIEKYADAKTESVGENIKFIAIVSVVLAIISAIEMLSLGRISLTGLPFATSLGNVFEPPIAAMVAFVGVIIGSVLLLLIGSVILHIFAIFLGAKKKYSDTVPAMVVFMLPNLLFGWIPFVNIWTSIYAFLIIVYVLARKQDLTMAKATTAIAVPIIIATAIAGAFGLLGAGGMIQTLVPVPGF
ncbi:MAG TPA: hypothetical protein DCK87_07915 [Desulfotomaculum sp.]|nr:hypothetical protein [Desulfotomaculum sp.]